MYMIAVLNKNSDTARRCFKPSIVMSMVHRAYTVSESKYIIASRLLIYDVNFLIIVLSVIIDYGSTLSIHFSLFSSHFSRDAAS